MNASLVITVDTEPDNQWTMPAGGRAADLSFRNTRGLGPLIDRLRMLGAPATWLTSYSVARDAESAHRLARAASEGDEIGAHLHAWETPPFTPADSTAHPYIYEYEREVRLAKLRTLTRALEDAFGATPGSHRAGRWGIDQAGLQELESCGYRIDSSVVPGRDFSGSPGLGRGGPSFRAALAGAPQRPWREGGLWEVPLSTTPIGVLGSGTLGAALARRFSHRTDLPGRLAGRLLGAAGLCRLIWVRPLVHERHDQIRAALSLLESGAPILNVMFHSSEAFEGTSARTRTAADVGRFYGDLEAVVGALLQTGRVTPRTLSGAVAALPDRADR
ncbi:MAG TPA: hypothetical protein VFP98_03250 [Candidatus Polarisedimenticolia bacterium]|nr:hypothetical protein [Candidatus Polarisedimenticolia bacterium]